MDAAAFCALSKFDCCSQCRNANTRRATTLRMTTTRAVWFFIVALTAIRLSMLATTDLEFDEAHYWMWRSALRRRISAKGPALPSRFAQALRFSERTNSECAFSVLCSRQERACSCFILHADYSTPRPVCGPSSR